MQKDKKITIITGHYGSGKTNIAINLALKCAKSDEKTVLVDLDIVNPYFRASDSASVLRENGIRVIAPIFANTNLDLPSLPAEINSVFDSDEQRVIIDSGGDDTGAVVLGRYKNRIKVFEYELLYVVSRYRPLTADAKEAAEILKEIEFASGLKATGLINNSSLGEDTAPREVRAAIQYAEKIAAITNLPIKYTTVSEAIAGELKDVKNLFPIKLYTKTYW